MKSKPKYQRLTWDIPGFNFIGKDCRYLLIDEVPAYVQSGQVILFQETEWSACIGCIAHSVHEAIDCPAPGLDHEQGAIEAEMGHVCLELLGHWIKSGVLIQTYSPN